jgi:biopolymer transport protein ExbD
MIFKRQIALNPITIIFAICLFLAGCGKKEQMPVTIEIAPDGRFLVDSKAMGTSDLKKHLIDVMRERGSDLRIIFVANKKTFFSVIEPIVLSAAKVRAWWFIFKQSDGLICEECVPNLVIGDGPPKLDLNMEIKDDIFFLDGKECTIADLKKLFAEKPKNKWGYFVFISCSGKTTFGRFCELLEFCRKYQYVSLNLNVMDKLYP